MKNANIVTSILIVLGLLQFSGFGQASRSRNEADLERRMQDMGALEPYAARRSEKDRSDKDRRDIGALNPPELDKKTKERVREMRMFDTRDIERYKNFLVGKETGIFKLFPNLDCVSDNVVSVRPACAGFVPETSDFSFRSVAYTTVLYHDLGYLRNELVSDSFFSQGVIVSIGDVPIERASLDLPGAKFLVDLKPDASIGEAEQNHQKFSFGTKMDGFDYSNRVVPSENTTYLIRNIAYRLSNSLGPIKPNSPLIELKFKSLDLDSRADVVVAFRIIRKDQYDGLTIVWKQLSRTDAPKLKFGKTEPLVDFK